MTDPTLETPPPQQSRLSRYPQVSKIMLISLTRTRLRAARFNGHCNPYIAVLEISMIEDVSPGKEQYHLL